MGSHINERCLLFRIQNHECPGPRPSASQPPSSPSPALASTTVLKSSAPRVAPPSHIYPSRTGASQSLPLVAISSFARGPYPSRNIQRRLFSSASPLFCPSVLLSPTSLDSSLTSPPCPTLLPSSRRRTMASTSSPLACMCIIYFPMSARRRLFPRLRVFAPRNVEHNADVAKQLHQQRMGQGRRGQDFRRHQPRR